MKSFTKSNYIYSCLNRLGRDARFPYGFMAPVWMACNLNFLSFFDKLTIYIVAAVLRGPHAFYAIRQLFGQSKRVARGTFSPV